MRLTTKPSSWYGRPVAALCLSLALVAVAGRTLASASLGAGPAAARPVLAVTVRHDGHDAQAMERDIAQPLEEAVSTLEGLQGLSSRSDYGRVELVARFARGVEASLAYERLSDATQRVYARLPASVQRPRVASYDEGTGPVWVAALSPRLKGAGEAEGGARPFGELLETVVRPALERLPGAGLVEIAGRGPEEILVELDAERAASRGLGLPDLALALARSDTLAAAGSLRLGALVIPVLADGRVAEPSEIASLSMPGSGEAACGVGSLATVIRRERPVEALSRVDGEPAVSVAVHGGGEAGLMRLSAALNAEAERLRTAHALDISVLVDDGAELAESYTSTLIAVCWGSLAAAMVTALASGSGSRRRGLRAAWRDRLAALLCLTLAPAMAASALVLVRGGLDRHTLTGLALGLAASSDSVVLCVERLGRASSIEEGRRRIRGLLPVLASGSLTTVVALAPLASLEDLADGVAGLAAAMASVTAASLFCAVVILPPLSLAGLDGTPHGGPGAPRRGESPMLRHARRLLGRALARNCRVSWLRPRFLLASVAALSLACLAVFVSRPVESRAEANGASLLARVEFDAGLAASEVDGRLAAMAKDLRELRGVRSVLSTARRGSGTLLLACSDEARPDLTLALSALEPPGGFVWVPGESGAERSWSLAVYGDEDAECRRLASEAASILSRLPFVNAVALGFKPGPETLIVRPNRERAQAVGVDFRSVAEALRGAFLGPVAYKRTSAFGETDVRVMAAPSGQGRDAVLGVIVPTAQGGARVEDLARASVERGPGALLRIDRRRASTVLLKTSALDVRDLAARVEASIASIAKPKGYSFEFDREALAAWQRVRKASLSFALAVALAYMALAALAESLTRPLAAVLALAPSLAPPAAVAALSGGAIDASLACAFIVVSGMAMNSSLLVMGGLAPGTRMSPLALYRLARSAAPSLAASVSASVAATLPFMVLAGGGRLGRVLAAVAAMGGASSALFSLLVIPALAVAAPRLFGRLDPDGRALRGQSASLRSTQ